jgi:hypothetical protein
LQSGGLIQPSTQNGEYSTVRGSKHSQPDGVIDAQLLFARGKKPLRRASCKYGLSNKETPPPLGHPILSTGTSLTRTYRVSSPALRITSPGTPSRAADAIGMSNTVLHTRPKRRGHPTGREKRRDVMNAQSRGTVRWNCSLFEWRTIMVATKVKRS